jgi:hypothetical protein
MKAAGILATIVVLATAATAQSGKVSVFTGPAGGVGNVVVFDERGAGAGQANAALQGIQLLPLDVAGRSRLTELLPGEPRLREDVPGAARIRLPGGAGGLGGIGSLYRYRRDAPQGGLSSFGFFVVDFVGAARPLVELAGTGPNGGDDPFPGRVAVSPSGTTILVATSVAAGGDLLEIDLATGAAVDRSAGLGPLDVLPGGLRLLSTWGAALTTSGPVRFERQPGAVAAAVPAPVTPYIADGIVASADGSTLAYVAGSDATQTMIYKFHRTGSADAATPSALHLSGPGFLPDSPSGPTLALSPDGSEVAFRTEESVSRECWSRPVASLAASSFQITSNALFEDTLNDSGVLGYLGPNATPSKTVVLAVGEQGTATQPLEGADLYRVDAAAGGGVTVTNLTLSSGVSQPPFAKGQIDLADGIHALPGTSKALYFQDTGNGEGEVRAVDVVTGTAQIVVDQVKSLDLVEVAGAWLALGVERSSGARPTDLWTMPVDLASPPLLLGSVASGVFRSPATRSDGTLATVVDEGGIGWLGRVQLPMGPGGFVSPALLTYGPTLAFTPSGGLAASLVAPSGTFVFTWSPTGALAVLPTGRVPGFVLPGA